MTLVMSVMRIHGLELTRRRLVLLLLALLPVTLYFAMAGGSESVAVVTGGTLLTFSISGPAVFIVLAGHQIDQRLALAGFRARHLIAGRLLILELLGLAVASLFGGMVLLLSTPVHPSLVLLGVYLVAVVAVPFGLALSSALPGDLEAFLTMIGVVGVQLALPNGSSAGRIGPFYGPQQVLYAVNHDGGGLLGPIVHAVVWATVLLAFAAFATHRRAHVDTARTEH